MIKKRFLSLFIDFMVIALVGIIVVYLNQFQMPVYVNAALRSLPFAYLFTKDSFTGQSFGRMLLNISLMDRSSHKAISPIKALGRNMFLMIWPVELVVLLLNGERIGDKATNCSVINKKVTHRIGFDSIALFALVWFLLFGLMWYIMTRGLMQLMY